LARTYFPAGNAIGKRITLALRPPASLEIVGIVGDLRAHGLANAEVPTTYITHPQLPYDTMSLAVRAGGDPRALASAIERAIHSVDKDQPVSDVRTMVEWVQRSLAQPRFNTLLLTIFSALALLLAVMGIYSVMSYMVMQRAPEIGLRIALGARTRDVFSLVVGHGALLTATGVALGIGGALAVNRAVASLLFDTATTDPATVVVVAALLASVGVCASAVPARRAASVDPQIALRGD
jgi:putative ABC transport system permease protein